MKTVLIFLLCYALGIGVYLSTDRNYRRREEHGSAKWGDPRAINRKYADKEPTANKILTQNVAIGLDGRRPVSYTHLLSDLTKKARKARLTNAAFIRRAVCGAEVREAPPADVPALIQEVRRVGNNLNQIMKRANALGLLDVPQLRKALELSLIHI